MKPQEGMNQTATQVKVLSPENFNIEEADSLHLLEGRVSDTAMARYRSLLRGLSPRYGSVWKLPEPGRPDVLSQKRIFENNPERGEFKNGTSGVGLTRSRGVTEVMFCELYSLESIKHLKGSALICRGEGIQSPITESEILWKQN